MRPLLLQNDSQSPPNCSNWLSIQAGIYRLVWVARRMVVMTMWQWYTCEMHLQWAAMWFYCTFPHCLTHGSWRSRCEWLRRPPEGPQQSSWDEASHDFPQDVYSLQKKTFINYHALASKSLSLWHHLRSKLRSSIYKQHTHTNPKARLVLVLR